MKFFCDYLDLKMDLRADMANVLVLESPGMYRDVVQNFITSVEEDNEDWIFSDCDKVLKKGSSIEIIYSIFLLGKDNKKFQKAATDDLNQIAMGENYFLKTQKLLSDLEELLYDLEQQADYNIKVKLGDFKDIIKIGVSEINVSENLLERLVEYIKLYAGLLRIKVLVLAGVQGCFTEEEWKEIEKAAAYENIYLLCFERRANFSGGNKIVIDIDGCRVV